MEENAAFLASPIEKLQIGPIAPQVVRRMITRTPFQDGLADSFHRPASRTELRYEKNRNYDVLYHDFASLRRITASGQIARNTVEIDSLLSDHRKLLRSGNSW